MYSTHHTINILRQSCDERGQNEQMNLNWILVSLMPLIISSLNQFHEKFILFKALPSLPTCHKPTCDCYYYSNCFCLFCILQPTTVKIQVFKTTRHQIDKNLSCSCHRKHKMDLPDLNTMINEKSPVKTNWLNDKDLAHSLCSKSDIFARLSHLRIATLPRQKSYILKRVSVWHCEQALLWTKFKLS